jgi:hypothetical protein
MASYVTILITTLMGALDAPWTSLLAGACILALLGLWGARSKVSGSSAIVAENVETVVLVSNSAIAAIAAFGLGKFASWIFT